jgi:D-alanyl-D-alanine dipeptidase
MRAAARWFSLLACVGVCSAWFSRAAVAADDSANWRALLAAGELVDVHKVDPTILVDLRYATAQNCVGKPIYPADLPCLTRPETALRLHLAQNFLRARGYGLKVWDAYRPPDAQQALWRRWKRRGFVADPNDGRGSLHTWGLAVDVTDQGKEIAMPSDFDVFSSDASAIYRGNDRLVALHIALLHAAMRDAGFMGLSTEWWHFAARDWQRYSRLSLSSYPPTAGGSKTEAPPEGPSGVRGSRAPLHSGG